ncbi:MAG: YdeI/OmpD-associated family protein [Cyclobacteriaceae bacterium]|jgi:hypothetical protein|nr:YdeI/OmpD-associated family protein [Flammeovirgaceae bacterium]
MKTYKGEQIIKQLEKRKGGYFYLKIESDIVNKFKNKRHTRFICTLDKLVSFQCGLNHLGEGDFFIILSTKNLKALDKTLGKKVNFSLKEDPNPLGVEMPEVLETILEQDKALKEIFDGLTLGKKRNVIHSINKLKDLDKQVQKAIKTIVDSTKPRPKRRL